MPNRANHLFEQITPDALHRAYLRARLGKRDQASTANFERGLGANLDVLYHELRSGTYEIQPYREFMVFEPKPREISAPAFRDRIVQHAIYAIVYPIFDRTFIYDSYGVRVGKGTHRSADRARRYLRESGDDSYTLQIDIQKYYASIDRRILQRLIERKLKDKHIIELMLRFAEHSSPTGLPIGNLLSQLYGLIYLDAFDHHVKRDLKVKRYVRYVDDIIFFNLSLGEARILLELVEDWLDKHLHLSLSKHRTASVKTGVNFVGFRTWRSLQFVRKHSLYHFNQSLKIGDVESLNAIMGHALSTATISHFRQRVAKERSDLTYRLAHMQ